MKNSSNLIDLNPTTKWIMNYVSVNVRPIRLTNVNEIVILYGFDESEKLYVVSVLNVKSSHIFHLFSKVSIDSLRVYKDFVHAFSVMKF